MLAPNNHVNTYKVDMSEFQGGTETWRYQSKTGLRLLRLSFCYISGRLGASQRPALGPRREAAHGVCLYCTPWYCLLYTLLTAQRVRVTSRFHQPHITDQQYKAPSGVWTRRMVRLPLQHRTVRDESKANTFLFNSSQNKIKKQPNNKKIRKIYKPQSDKSNS